MPIFFLFFISLLLLFELVSVETYWRRSNPPVVRPFKNASQVWRMRVTSYTLDRSVSMSWRGSSKKNVTFPKHSIVDKMECSTSTAQIPTIVKHYGKYSYVFWGVKIYVYVHFFWFIQQASFNVRKGKHESITQQTFVSLISSVFLFLFFFSGPIFSCENHTDVCCYPPSFVQKKKSSPLSCR